MYLNRSAQVRIIHRNLNWVHLLEYLFIYEWIGEIMAVSAYSINVKVKVNCQHLEGQPAHTFIFNKCQTELFCR